MISPATQEQGTSYPNSYRGFFSVLATVLFFFGVQVQAQYTTSGLTYPTGNDGLTPGTCYAPGGKSCWWVDCDAVSDGTGTSAASPAWGFEGIGGYYSAGSFNQGSAVGGDHIYVKGTCKVTGSVDSAVGPYKQLLIARPGQLGTQSEPLVIRSWPGVTQGIFDGEYLDTLTAPNDATNNPIYLIGIFPTSAPSALAVKIENIKVTRARRSGINCGYSNSTVAYCDISSVWFEDNDIDPNGLYAPLLLDAGATDWPQAHTVRNCKFTNNYRNCTTDGGNISGDAACGAEDNDGAINIYSIGNSLGLGTVDIYNSYFDNNTKHIRDKQNGSATVSVYNNWLGSSEGEALYDRHTAWVVHHNIFDMGAGAKYVMVVTDDPPPPTRSRSVTFYNNSIFGLDRLIDIQPGVGAYTDYVTWSIYNNAIQATSSTGRIVVIDQEGGATNNTFTTAKMTMDHNYYNVAAASQTNFSCLAPASAGSACTQRTFAQTMSYLSDVSSSVTDPQFTNAASDLFCLQSGASSRTAGRSSGYIGAIDPATCSSSSAATITSPVQNYLKIGVID